MSTPLTPCTCPHTAEVRRLRAALEAEQASGKAAARNYIRRIQMLEAKLAAITATGKRTRTRRTGVRPWPTVVSPLATATDGSR